MSPKSQGITGAVGRTWILLVFPLFVASPGLAEQYGVKIDTSVGIFAALTAGATVYLGTSTPTSYYLDQVDLSSSFGSGAASLGIAARPDSQQYGLNQTLAYTQGLSSTSIPSSGQAAAAYLTGCDPTADSACLASLTGGALGNTYGDYNTLFGPRPASNGTIQLWARPQEGAVFQIQILQDQSPFFFLTPVSISTAGGAMFSFDGTALANGDGSGYFAGNGIINGFTTDPAFTSGQIFYVGYSGGIHGRYIGVGMNHTPGQWQDITWAITGDTANATEQGAQVGVASTAPDGNLYFSDVQSGSIGGAYDVVKLAHGSSSKSLDVEPDGVHSSTNVAVAGNLTITGTAYLGWERDVNACGTGITTCTVSCPTGKKATGGGCDASGIALTKDAGDDTSWTCAASVLTTLSATVYCARIGD